jgi:hypothetical protein
MKLEQRYCSNYPFKPAAEVVDIINDKMVMVNAGGVRFPYTEIRSNRSHLKRFMEKKNGNRKAKTICR